MHFNLYYTITAACFATSAFNIKAKSSFSIASHLSFGKSGEQISYAGEHSSVCGRIRSRRSPYRRLVDIYDLVDVLDAEYRIVLAGFFQCPVGYPGNAFVKDFVYQAALAGT